MSVLRYVVYIYTYFQKKLGIQSSANTLLVHAELVSPVPTRNCLPLPASYTACSGG